MTSGCLDRKEVRGAIWGVHSTTDRPAGGNTGRLFLAFGGPVCADRISNCPLDRVLTYKNLIYLLNLQYYFYLMAYEDCDTIVFTHSVCMAWCVVRPHFLKLLESTPRFYPRALKGCRGIVFTHGVRMGGRQGGQWEKVCPGCISETVRCRKLILGRDIG